MQRSLNFCDAKAVYFANKAEPTVLPLEILQASLS